MLLSSENCGALIPPASLTEYYGNYMPYLTVNINSASAYAQQCYTNSSFSQFCSLYVQKELPINIDKNASCPFPGKEKICLRNSGNLRLDTGPLDSHIHFGMNTEPGRRFTYRRIIECAPLQTAGYTRTNTSSPLFSSQNASLDFMYGKSISQFPGVLYNDFTYQNLVSSSPLNPDDANYVLEFVFLSLALIYTNVNSFKGYDPYASNETDFLPIPELRVDDAVTSLLFLSAKGVAFFEPVDDDWYSAHQPGPPAVLDDIDGNFPLYYTDRVANVLGCVARRQICNPVSARCSSLSYEPTPHAPWSSEEQEKTFNFWWATLGLSTLDIPRFKGTSSLKAYSNFFEGLQGPLPSDQWQQEIIYWESIALAYTQRKAVEAVTGPSDPALRQYVEKNVPGLISGDFCVQQKIKSTDHTCFSVLGLTITLVLGGLIIILSNLTGPLYAFLRKRQKKFSYRQLEWATNETLQLQRMVHEELGLGTWSETLSSIPITEKDEKLGVLDMSNKEHPVMIRPDSGTALEKINDQIRRPANASETEETDHKSSEKLQNPSASSNSSIQLDFLHIEGQPDKREKM